MRLRNVRQTNRTVHPVPVRHRLVVMAVIWIDAGLHHLVAAAVVPGAVAAAEVLLAVVPVLLVAVPVPHVVVARPIEVAQDGDVVEHQWIAHRLDVMIVVQCVTLAVAAHPHVAHHVIAHRPDVHPWIARLHVMVVLGVAVAVRRPVVNARHRAMPGAVEPLLVVACRLIVVLLRQWLVVARHLVVVLAEHPWIAHLLVTVVLGVAAVARHLVAHARLMMARAVAHVATLAIEAPRRQHASRRKRRMTMAGRLRSTDVGRCAFIL